MGRRPSRAPVRALPVVGLVAALVAPACIGLGAPAGIRLVAVLAFGTLVPGAALLCHFPVGDAAVSWALAVVLSWSVCATIAVVMAWSATWHPLAALLCLDALCVASLGARLVTAARRQGTAS